MARPRKTLTPEQVEQVERLAALLTQDQIADYLGISERTLRQRIHDDPAINAAYQRGRGKAISGAAGKLLQMAMSGNVTALIFYLKTQAHWKETVTQELTGELPALVVMREQKDAVA